MPVGDHFVVFSGWGVTSNWYRNLRANPEVDDHRRPAAHARHGKVVDDPARRTQLMLQMQARSAAAARPNPSGRCSS